MEGQTKNENLPHQRHLKSISHTNGGGRILRGRRRRRRTEKGPNLKLYDFSPPNLMLHTLVTGDGLLEVACVHVRSLLRKYRPSWEVWTVGFKVSINGQKEQEHLLENFIAPECMQNVW